MRLRWVLLGLLVVALLVAAATVTVARALQPDAGRRVRLVALTPYALVLYAVLLLLMVLVVVSLTGLWRRAGAWALVAVVLLGGLHVWWLIPLYAGSTPVTASTNSARLTVMAANLQRGGADPSRVMEIVRANGVDVLVLSEITSSALEGLQAAGLDEAFSSVAGEAEAGLVGTMVFSRYDITGEERLDTVLGGYEVEMVTPQLGPIRFLGVHASPPFGDADAWHADHRQIFDHVESSVEDTVLLAGDFNATPDHEPLERLREIGIRTAAARADSGLQPTWPSPVEKSFLGVGVPSVLQIDHVLVDATVRAVGSETVTIEGTDHRAVVATLVPR